MPSCTYSVGFAEYGRRIERQRKPTQSGKMMARGSIGGRGKTYSYAQNQAQRRGAAHILLLRLRSRRNPKPTHSPRMVGASSPRATMRRHGCGTWTIGSWWGRGEQDHLLRLQSGSIIVGDCSAVRAGWNRRCLPVSKLPRLRLPCDTGTSGRELKAWRRRTLSAAVARSPLIQADRL
jgi:hypothetical protein